MEILIPPAEVAEFKELFQSPKYRKDERDYKWFVNTAVGGGGGLRGAMGNLGGGKWGLAQFAWFPRAVEFGLGGSLADAFRALVKADETLATRVDAFRDQLYVASENLQQKGGYLPGWTLFRVSRAFVAVVLAGYDPSKYTFYSSGALRYAYRRFSSETAWPDGTTGQVYENVCSFVQAVAESLRTNGVPVTDLIYAQSFIWIKFREQSKPKGSTSITVVADGESDEVDVATVAADLSKATYWPLHRARRLVEMAIQWGQLLFQGPPGTGKTYVAETLAKLLSGDEEGRVEVVQFHPSYAYEDFVEGIRPVVTEGSNLAYEVRRGIFLKLTDLAKEHEKEDFFLVIDELNRANVPRVFGELLYAMEYRGPQHPFRLPYSGGEAYVPTNLKFIATMNSADRSIALVDAALRRRFRHVAFAPDIDVLEAWLQDHDLSDLAPKVTDRLASLNERLGELLDPDRLIGHTYLMRSDLREAGLESVWEEDIGPILREHLFGQPDELNKLHEHFVAPV